MNVQAESWDGKGGIGVVGCRRFEMLAQDADEAIILAGIAAAITQAMGEEGKVIESDLEYVDGTHLHTASPQFPSASDGTTS